MEDHGHQPYIERDLPGGVGGCGCGSVDEGEFCGLTCGTAAVEGGGGSKKRVEGIIRTHRGIHYVHISLTWHTCTMYTWSN